MADQVRDEQHLSMSMFVNPADYWQAMYERRETEAHQLSEQIIRICASHAAEVEALRSALEDMLDLITESLVRLQGARIYPAGEERIESARAALKGDKP